MAENIGGSGSPVPKGRRIASDIIDLIIVPIVLGLILGLILLNVPEGVRSGLLIVINIAWLIFRDMVYSPGRAMVGLKLVSDTSGKVTLPQAFIRNVLLMVPFVLIIGYIVELIAVLSKGNRIADAWAKTRVVS